MRLSTRLRVFILIFCLALVVVPLWRAGLLPGAAWRTALYEEIMGETPRAKITMYLRAVASGDESAALAAWELPDWQLPLGRSATLASRRSEVTHKLIAAGTRPDLVILCTERWRTCCEPGVTSDPSGAGGARVRVQLLDAKGTPSVYILDVFTRGPYWGSAVGYPPRDWALRDVYPAGEEPLYFRLVNESTVRSLDYATPTPVVQ